MASEQISFKRLIDIGIALSAEKDVNRLMERILLEAKDIANADGGTLYIRTREDALKFEMLRTDSLGIAEGGTSGTEISMAPIEMFETDDKPNLKAIVSYAANTGETINIADAYATEEFDFTGAKIFDETMGYRSKSFLAVPLKNNTGYVIGVLQLINSLDPETGQVCSFSIESQPLIEALASQAAIALENQNLLDAQKNLLDSFINLMASAVDAKSPYTGGHCQRVPELTEMLTAAACDSDAEPFKTFDLDDAQWYELHIGAWLHDCGKITTPEYVVDKSTKLETITDRIHEIRMRFELVKAEHTIAYQKKLLDGAVNHEELKDELDTKLASLDEDFAFIAESNLGGEFMAEDRIERVREIAEIKWTRTLDDRLGISFDETNRKNRTRQKQLPCSEFLLEDRTDHIVEHNTVVHSSDPNNSYGFKVDVPKHKYNLGEVYNLSVSRGTLTKEERFKINDHIVQTIVMLESLPFPKHLEQVPEIAGGHHEKMDGTGFPKGIKGKDMSIPARIMAIADVFEALTAADRPYKPPKKLSTSIRIMGNMVLDHHLDPDLFKLFLTSGVYMEYAKKFLQSTQIDNVDIQEYM